jgi:hypothetical protein
VRAGKKRVRRSVAALERRGLCGLLAGRGGASCALIADELAMHGLFEQIAQQKRVLQILARRDAAVAAENHDRPELQLRDDLGRIGDRRRFVADDRDLADRIFLLEGERREALMRQRKRQHHRRMRVDDRLRVGAAIDREVHRRLARRPALFVDRLTVEIDLDNILGRQKAERRVLPGDEHAVFADAAA